MQPDVAQLMLAPEAARAVAGFVREAVINALVHGATPVRVLAGREPGGAPRLVVRDDGHGYDPKRTAGLGLEAMRQHALALGGRIVHSGPSSARAHEVTLLMQQP